MQLVSRKILFDVMAHRKPVVFKNPNSLDEVDSVDKTAFQTFMKSCKELYDKAESLYDNHTIAMSEFSDMMYKFMKYNKQNIRYVGKGSSRIVYALADGTCLKVAGNPAGQAQNKQEAKICLDSSFKYEIFPDFYDTDRENWLALNCEMCAQATMNDFAHIFKLQPAYVLDIVNIIVQTKVPNDEFEQVRKYYVDQQRWTYAYFVSQLIDKPNEPANKAILSLIDFYRKNGLDELLIDDLDDPRNWGLTVRDGKQVLVVIDAGFNEDVFQQHYKGSNNEN